MIVDVFDGDHGSCALAIGQDGSTVLFDCGHNELTGFRPSVHIGGLWRGLDQLVVSHADEDHLSDLPNILAICPPSTLTSNPSVDSRTIRVLKLLSDARCDVGVTAFRQMRERYSLSATGVVGGVGRDYELFTFWNTYPRFLDCNNLSLVAFLEFGDVRMVFPGDLECRGWEALLDDPWFRYRLSRVNVFVASHHGRESGYCADVFQFCRPEIILVSDWSVRFDSQSVDYARHASGVLFADGSFRSVLTTRCDGRIRVQQLPGQRPWVLHHAA
jgi:beta-lactamase superfamily II metal-dependent hydrolase